MDEEENLGLKKKKKRPGKLPGRFLNHPNKSILHESPTGDLAIEQSTLNVEPEDRFDLVKAQTISHQNLSANVIRLTLFIVFCAGIIIDINLAVDDLTAAFAFDTEIIKFTGVGGRTGDQFLEETHGTLLCKQP
jgi:hypothetical protein